MDGRWADLLWRQEFQTGDVVRVGATACRYLAIIEPRQVARKEPPHNVRELEVSARADASGSTHRAACQM